LVITSIEMLPWLSFRLDGLASVQRLVSSDEVVEEAVLVAPKTSRPKKRVLVIVFLVSCGVFFSLLIIVGGEWAGDHPILASFLALVSSGHVAFFWQSDLRILGWTQQELLVCRTGTWPFRAAGVEKRLSRDTPMIGIGSQTGWRNVEIDGERYTIIKKKDRVKLRAEFRSPKSTDVE